MKLQLILGSQLFPVHFYQDAEHIFMCEDLGLCTHFRYHKHKLIFFLAAMRNYRDTLSSNPGKTVHYFELDPDVSFFRRLRLTIDEKSVSALQCFEIEDKFFEKALEEFCQDLGIKLSIAPSPMFLVTRDAFREYKQRVKKPFMKSFYEGIRQDHGILMTKENTPIGGKYSFDAENRKKIPKKFNVIQTPLKSKDDQNTRNVIALVDRYFPDHPGSSNNFWLEVDRKGALDALNYFFANKFENFGVYEDAIDDRDPFLYHSVLSPYLNIGFITPEEIIEKALEAEAPLNSKEGFIRQVIGWREFIRGIYQEYSEIQSEANFFSHQNKLGEAWYTGETGIPPLDDAIRKALSYGYCHHIERLMIISNIMLLCEIAPKEVHGWFMEMFVDSSDWVMGPNVYGMSQFSDGGIFATKPYIAGSNYIRKMSHYKKDSWDDILDGLYWRFIEKHRDFFGKNYRMSMMVKMLDKLDRKRKARIFQKAETFISRTTRQ